MAFRATPRTARVVFTAVCVGILLPAPPAYGSSGWAWPLEGEVITPYRNGSDPYAAGQHRGIDIAGEVGERVRAAAGGTVRFAGGLGTSGLTVSVRTADGRFDVSYLHLSAIDVREGDRVAEGDRIGAVGTTGRRSASRPHLHLGVREAGSRHAYRDPLDFLPPRAPGGQPEPAPRVVPVPVGSPLEPRPSPVPLRAPKPRAHPAPHPRLAPVPRPRRVPAHAGRRVAAPRPAPVALPTPEGSPTPLRSADERARAALQASGSPALGLAPEAGAEPPRSPQPSRTSSAAGQTSAAGPDLGWLLACAGLLLAAALAGTGEGRSATRRGRMRAAMLRPLTGRG